MIARATVHAVAVRVVFVIVLCALCLAIYGPSFSRFFVSDQLLYLAELNGDRSLSAGLRLLDYAEARQMAKGDNVLYRPFLFALLAIKNALLGVDFRAWNFVHLLFHIALTYLLFEVLMRVRPSIVAPGIALWFGALAANFGIVTWSHLGGYLWGYGLLLIACLALWEGRRDPQASPAWPWIYGVAIIGAMLFHEIAVVTAVLIALFWLAVREVRPAWRVGVVAPLFVYALIYSWRSVDPKRLLWVDPEAVAEATSSHPLLLTFAALGQWTTKAVVPDFCLYYVAPYYRYRWAESGDVVTWASVLALGLTLGILVALRKGLTRKRLADGWPFAVLMVLIMLAYAAMISLGRNYMLEVTYYVYFYALFGFFTLYLLLDFDKITRRAQCAALICMIGLTALNARQVYANSVRVDRAHDSVTRFYTMIDEMVAPHLATPDFTFAVRNAPEELNTGFSIPLGYPDEGQRVNITVLEMLYGRHYNEHAPHMTLSFAPD